MNTLGQLAGLAIVMVSVGAFAFDGVQGSSRDATSVEPDANEELKVPKYSPTQILCVRQRREGSRVMQTKCQTLAEWKHEINLKDMRVSMIRAPRKAGWETSP